MKKVFLLFVIALTTALAAPESKYVEVELLSGTRQRAQFLGIENDTVSLGGYIQNKFTVVKIATNQFKKIVDEQGNDLLNAKTCVSKDTTITSKKATEASNATEKNESQTQSSSSFVVASSSSAEEIVANETFSSSSAQPIETTKPTLNETIDNPQASTVKTILIAYKAVGTDPSIADHFTALTARLLTESGEKPQIISKEAIQDCADNICIQNKLASHGFKSIYLGEIASDIRTDSLTLSLTHAFYEDSLPMLHKASVNVSRQKAFEDAITNNKLKNQLLEAQGKKTIITKKNRAYIHVETDPDGATISRSEKNALCKSPCTFVTSDTSKFTIHAYWNVDRHLWGASTNIIPLSGDTVHVSLKLKRVAPEIRIQTFPEGAQVFKANSAITKHTKAIAKTPEKIPMYNMGTDSLIIRKAGYRDTLVNFFVAPISQIDLSIDLEKLTDFDEIEKQNKWLHDKKMQTLGDAFIGGAAGTAIIGALLMYFAHLDYSDADDIKADLKIPGAVKGSNYQDKVKQNHKLVNQGDNKAIAGGILLGTAAALLGVGLYFHF